MTTPPPEPPGHDPLAAFENDGAIPMLTEVIDLDDAAPEQPAWGPPAPQGAQDEPGTADWDALEQRVRDDVLERLARHIDTLFTERLEQATQAAIERATRQIGSELRGALAELTRDLVTRAVAEEVTRAQLDLADRDAEPF